MILRISGESADIPSSFFLVGYIWEKSYDPCPLDGSSHFSLVHGAVAGDPLRKDLASFGHIFSEFFNIFVIDSFGLVGTELANFFAPLASAGGRFVLTFPPCGR